MGNEIHRHADVRENVIEHSHHHDPNDVTDYMEAVKAYRATFPTKQDVHRENSGSRCKGNASADGAAGH